MTSKKLIIEHDAHACIVIICLAICHPLFINTFMYITILLQPVWVIYGNTAHLRMYMHCSVLDCNLSIFLCNQFWYYFKG